jgi:hypothetical protein
MRLMLTVAGGFVLVAGFQLFVLTERTEDFFAWTINPPLTAAFLGAGYWGAAFLELGASRLPVWSTARVAIPAVLLFTTVTLGVTLIHLDRFHTSSLFGITWIAVYVAFPPLMAWALWLQVRMAGPDPQRRRRLPGWLRVALVVQAAVLIPFGIALLAAPGWAGELWPWPLTPLTGRAVGAWLLGIGILAVHMTLENAFERVTVAMGFYVAFGVLQLVALARYTDTPELSGAGTTVYAAFLAAMVVIGLYSLLAARRLRSSEALLAARAGHADG